MYASASRQQPARKVNMEMTTWFVAAVAVAAGATGAHQVVARQRNARHESNLIGPAMRRFGVTPADAEAVGLEPALQQAQKRCGTCLLQQECRSRLGGLRRGLPEGCPNAGLFTQIARERARIQPPLVRRRAVGVVWPSPPRI